MEHFLTTTIDKETGMKLYLSECSYNTAIDWLVSRGFRYFDKLYCDHRFTTMEFSKPVKRTWVYDEKRGYLLANMKLGEWLDGNTMLSELLNSDITKEQARAVVTTYCLIFDIEVDTIEWNTLIESIYDSYNSWFDSYDEMDNFMAELLV